MGKASIHFQIAKTLGLGFFRVNNVIFTQNYVEKGHVINDAIENLSVPKGFLCSKGFSNAVYLVCGSEGIFY